VTLWFMLALNAWTLWRWRVTLDAWERSLQRERELLVLLDQVAFKLGPRD
jgi:hypothetical protein